jgi:hypothetical protein
LILGKRRTVAGVLVACLAVLSRPDAGFLALALIAWAALFAPGHRLPLKRAAPWVPPGAGRVPCHHVAAGGRVRSASSTAST